MDNYHVLEIIGEGSFGKVYKGRRKYTGKIVALKFIPKHGRSEKELQSLRKEIDIMRGMNHANIIEMLDTFETEKEVVAVTDYAEGELFQVLEDDGALPEEQVQEIACQLVSALYYLHAHRILHRDMKPQNILLGKGGVVKLCDFGFARAMSVHTLVLTSIKGTPLYMAPELIEEKPYDHTTDLWSLGCILYELFVGTPPFYTNSIFQLVSLIIKDPVKWPKTMSPQFKDFLQGLLTKNAAHRLSWPQLLYHPFLEGKVQPSDSLSQSIQLPFTEEPTPEMQAAKAVAAKQKTVTVPAGTTIMRKLKGREQQEAAQATADRQEAWAAQQAKKPPGAKPKSKPLVKSNPWPSAKPSDQTPKENPISQDYKREFPDVEVESSATCKKKEGSNTRRSIDNVQLKEEEGQDSEDEWDSLCDVTSPESADPLSVETLLKDATLTQRIKSRLEETSSQVLDGMLEGASKLRLILRVINNVLAFKGFDQVLEEFCCEIGAPQKILDLLMKIKDNTNVKKQAWCVQILIDLVSALIAYTVSEIGFKLTLDRAKQIMDISLQFAGLLPWLLHVKQDNQLMLRAQTIYCFLYQSETMDRSPPEFVTGFFSSLSTTHKDIVVALLQALIPEEAVIKRLQVSLKSDEEAAACWEQVTGLCIGSLAELVFIPLGLDSCIEGKRKMAAALGEKFCEESKLCDNFLSFVQSPTFGENALKTVYFTSQMSPSFCKYLSEHDEFQDIILLLLQGKLDIEDMYKNVMYEMGLQTISVVMMQTQSVPHKLLNSSVLFAAILLDSQVASHTTAAALLVSQLLHFGVTIEMPVEDLLTAIHSALNDLSQICVQCPFDYGVLDGLMLLLCQFLGVAQGLICRYLLESGVWDMIWQRMIQSLGISQMPVKDVEDQEENQPQIITLRISCDPQWNLLSPSGVMAALQVFLIVFTQEPYQCVPSLCAADSATMVCLSSLLSEEFLDILDRKVQSQHEHKDLATDLIIHVSQLLCFPFAIDTHTAIMQSVVGTMYDCHIVSKLVLACKKCIKNPEMMEVPLGLISRLVLGQEEFMEQFVHVMSEYEAQSFLSEALSSGSGSEVQSDALSICSHLARTSEKFMPVLYTALQGKKKDFQCLVPLLESSNVTVISRTCGTIGNMLRHSNKFYSTLKTREQLMQELLRCLSHQDADVRKAATYAVGNAAYHSGELYGALIVAIPVLVELLSDPMMRTRTNAAGALGNLGRHSHKLTVQILKAKVPERLMQVACHDSQYGVQEVALVALRTLSRQPRIKQVLIKQKALEKLSKLVHELNSTGVSLPALESSHSKVARNTASSVLLHTTKLQTSLKRTSSAR